MDSQKLRDSESLTPCTTNTGIANGGDAAFGGEGQLLGTKAEVKWPWECELRGAFACFAVGLNNAELPSS